MLEPTPRYPPSVGVASSRLQIDTSSLDTAVDLSRKNDAGHHDVDADQDDSEDEAPLDLKVNVVITNLLLTLILFLQTYFKVNISVQAKVF